MQRRVDLEGPSNFRDLGGLPTASGGLTRFGRVFRADRLCTLSDADLLSLGDLGIRRVFDLRSDGEVAEFPDRMPQGALCTRLPMTSDTTFQSRTIYERIVAGEITVYGETEMVEGYLRILENFAEGFALITRTVGESDPVLIHCTAGKDRTGVAAMLLLDLAGVEPDQIVADYELSAQRRPSRLVDHTEARTVTPLLEDHGLDPAQFAPLWEARGAVMAATLAGLHDKWGGAAGYLRAAGLSETCLQAARACLQA
ncbi:MAG: tyrosine-protein phosphatase [Acidimicrobiaceae bacterium]|nr:tyrosine-protein phosphatase [Acidimicrobiaceae bacterium]MCY4293841.1 tyrosine-protein phosphatase [Acidimicrobiaceae bacterium]